MEYSKSDRVWTRLNNNFVESAKIFEEREETLIVGYEDFNQTILKFERDKDKVFETQEKAQKHF